MPLTIRQETEYLGSDRWKWAVWVDGAPEELDRMMYILHRTFIRPVREVSDRNTNFRLEAKSWGVFTLLAKAKFKDGREETLTHDLELLYPDGTPTTA